VGEMEIIETPKADPTQFVPNHKYYDPKSLPENPRWLGPVVSFHKKYKRTVSLDEIKADSAFADLPFVKKGNRLSVISITKDQYVRVEELVKKK